MKWFWKRKSAEHIVVDPKSKTGIAIYNELYGVTERSTLIARCIKNGLIQIHLMNRLGFLEERKGRWGSWLGGGGIQAWATANHIFIQDKRNKYKMIVHEGDHALRFLDGTTTWGQYKLGPITFGKMLEESDVRRFERQFSRAKGTNLFVIAVNWWLDSLAMLGYML